jgi:hypothetical protein
MSTPATGSDKARETYRTGGASDTRRTRGVPSRRISTFTSRPCKYMLRKLVLKIQRKIHSADFAIQNKVAGIIRNLDTECTVRSVCDTTKRTLEQGAVKD